MNTNDAQNTSATTSTATPADQQDSETQAVALSSELAEHLPATWDDDRDGRFFRLVHDAFSPDFLLGATVLLASYDAE